MKPLTGEWVRKAEEDFIVATQLARHDTPPVPTAICFHCQQCAEKYLKARLQEAEISFPKTHNLVELLILLLPVEPLWETLRPFAQPLTNYAIEFRYPGDDASGTEAQRAVAMYQTIRHTVRVSLGLEDAQGEFRVRERAAKYRTPAKRKRRTTC